MGMKLSNAPMSRRNRTARLIIEEAIVEVAAEEAEEVAVEVVDTAHAVATEEIAGVAVEVVGIEAEGMAEIVDVVEGMAVEEPKSIARTKC